MRKKFSVVLALAMVFSLVFSSVAMAVPEGKTISNKLELEVNVKKAGETEKGTIEVNDNLAKQLVVGLWDVFTVSTAPPEGSSQKFVKGKVELLEGDKNFKLEYLEQDPHNSNYGKFFEMNFDNNVAYFGPEEGFPWLNVEDSMFRVTWNEVGAYTFKVSIVDATSGEELASTDEIVVDVEEEHEVYKPIDLWHLEHEVKNENGDITFPEEGEFKGGKLEINAEENDKFGYWVNAFLYEGVDHVDGVNYVFEVTKEGNDISDADLQIKYFESQAGYSERELPVSMDNGKLTGVFGPEQGFTFYGLYDDEGETVSFIPAVKSPVMTPFEVTFKTGGKYSASIYAIQLPAAPEFPLPELE